MKIKLRLYATLTKHLGDQPAGTNMDFELPLNSTLSDLADMLNIPSSEVKICFVNGIICELEKEIQDGDEVGLFPPIGGG